MNAMLSHSVISHVDIDLVQCGMYGKWFLASVCYNSTHFAAQAEACLLPHQCHSVLTHLPHQPPALALWVLDSQIRREGQGIRQSHTKGW